MGNEELDIPGLYLSDINWEKKRLMIRGKGWRSGKIPPLEQPIDSTTLQMIKDYASTNGLREGDKLFNLSTRQVRKIIKDISVRAMISNSKYMSPHSLRAFFITRIIEEFDIETARRLARHRDIKTTQRYSFLAMKKIQER